jgi:FlaA1/EpsC-like NDP-sugar epimerase
MITLEEGVRLVWKAFDDMLGGEIYVKKIPSMTIGDIAKAVDFNAKQVTIGIRPGEKIHEQMIGLEDAPHTFEYDTYYKILPAIHSWSSDPLRIKDGKLVPDDFTYTSENNSEWMSVEELKSWIAMNKQNIGQI